MPSASPAERHVGAATVARILGRWSLPGPGYVALADGLRRCVLDGTLPLWSRMPSERDLAAALGVSRTTTSAAYQRLRELGFLVTRRGSGSVTTLPGGRRHQVGALVADESDDYAGGPGRLVDLTMAAPSAPTELHHASVRALEALPRHLSGTGYTYLGLPALRAALAERYTRRGTPTRPDEILVTSGAQPALSLLTGTLAGPGDRIVLEHPTYPNTIGAVRAVSARPVPVPVGAHGVDVDLLESAVRQTAPRLVHLTPDHHNPTGTSLDEDARERVRRLAEKHRTLVVGDETLTDLTLDGPAPSSFTGPVTRATLVTVGSASKTFWGGLRVGWIRGHRDLVARLAAERAHHDISTALLDQLVLVELLEVEDQVLATRRAELRERRDALVAALTREVPWRVTVPAGGLALWVDLGAPVSSALGAVAPRYGVRTVPGPIFGVDGSFESRLRLPFCLPVEDLEQGVSRLATAWAAVAPDDAPAAGGARGTRHGESGPTADAGMPAAADGPTELTVPAPPFVGAGAVV